VGLKSGVDGVLETGDQIVDVVVARGVGRGEFDVGAAAQSAADGHFEGGGKCEAAIGRRMGSAGAAVDSAKLRIDQRRDQLNWIFGARRKIDAESKAHVAGRGDGYVGAAG